MTFSCASSVSSVAMSFRAPEVGLLMDIRELARLLKVIHHVLEDVYHLLIKRLISFTKSSALTTLRGITRHPRLPVYQRPGWR